VGRDKKKKINVLVKECFRAVFLKPVEGKIGFQPICPQSLSILYNQKTLWDEG
jgi:hypothetical protein